MNLALNTSNYVYHIVKNKPLYSPRFYICYKKLYIFYDVTFNYNFILKNMM